MENDSQLTTAAAEGAAAAVAAVQDDQAEAERQSGMENAVTDATIAAEVAANSAVSATQASEIALESSAQASEEAATASAIAASAVETANDARDTLAGLREELDARDARLLAALDERFGPRQQSDQPREVVVTNASPTQPADTGEGDNSGSSGSAGTGTNRPANRHRFGSRRT